MCYSEKRSAEQRSLKFAIDLLGNLRYAYIRKICVAQDMFKKGFNIIRGDSYLGH